MSMLIFQQQANDWRRSASADANAKLSDASAKANVNGDVVEQGQCIKQRTKHFGEQQS